MANRPYSAALQTRHRMPGEIGYRSTSIYNQCRHCRGWEGNNRSLLAEVKACPNISCPLWPFRTQAAASKRHTGGCKGQTRGSAIKEFCNQCQCVPKGSRRTSVKECQTKECWLWPWRNGPVDQENENA
jgi:hypothetical protein